MELVAEYTEAKRKSAGDRLRMKEIFYERRWFILSKLLEYPVSLLAFN